MQEEIERLCRAWGVSGAGDDLSTLLGEAAGDIDLLDLLQLQAVIDICRQTGSLSEAGRRLFDISRQGKAQPNDADRLRKYLARFGLSWQSIRRE
ncbi:hypothetical protein [Pseudomonas sp. PA15(2017)]|uniref:hypothetical protein n=1 Tax=Pseudomonas sp. PA15(2017) TaxID=1932111 RepID=UPI000B1611E0|nr:hypothetical protein [Pseudomonas sp. PA15(2017)]